MAPLPQFSTRISHRKISPITKWRENIDVCSILAVEIFASLLTVVYVTRPHWIGN